MDKNFQAVANLNNKVITLFENPFVKYGFLIFIVLRIMFIERMDDWYLELFDYWLYKIVYAILVAYSGCVDPVYAIALGTFIIICIQENHMRKAKKNMKLTNNLVTLPSSPPNKLPEITYETPINNNNTTMSKDTDDTNMLMNKHIMQLTPDVDNKLITSLDFYIDPAYQTLTTNIQDKYKNKFHITNNSLDTIQTNNMLPSAYDKKDINSKLAEIINTNNNCN